MPDGRGWRTNVTGIALRHRRHHAEAPHAERPACLPALLAPAGNGRRQGGRVERGARLVEPLLLLVVRGKRGGSDIVHCDGARIWRRDMRGPARCCLCAFATCKREQLPVFFFEVLDALHGRRWCGSRLLPLVDDYFTLASLGAKQRFFARSYATTGR